MNPTVLDRSFRSFSRIPWVRSRYAPIAAAVVGISGKNARSGVHGTVTTGPSIGTVMPGPSIVTGFLATMGLCPPLIGLPSRPAVWILRDPLTHPTCTVFCSFPLTGDSVSPFRVPSTDSHDCSTTPPRPTTFVKTNWSCLGIAVRRGKPGDSFGQRGADGLRGHV